MSTDWAAADRWLMGEAWTGSRIGDHLNQLCEVIGPRWASSEGEWQAIDYIQGQFQMMELEPVTVEEYDVDTWKWDSAEARLLAVDGHAASAPIDLLPFNRCQPCGLEGPVVDVGYGTPREIDAVKDLLPRAIAVMFLAYEPFTTPIPHTRRLLQLAETGVAAVIAIDVKDGRRVEYHSAADWRDREFTPLEIPVVTTSREHGALLRRHAGSQLSLKVDSEFYAARSANVSAELAGAQWPEEHLLFGAHHDTVYGVAGGNDNASGTIAVLETARVLAALCRETSVQPGRSIRFCTFSAEEQRFQGSHAYVDEHYLSAAETPARLTINLDELSTGHFKGLVLGFPHLRDLVQGQLDTMKDGLKCHVMSQIDASSDHFPFLKAGLDAAHLWRWRFRGRHADSDYHHEAADTSDKLNVRELKEYAGQLARLLLRLSHVPPDAWPHNPVTPEQVATRLEAERGTVVRVF